MNDFYTSVAIKGNTVYLRGIKDGHRFQEKINYYKPVLYLPTRDISKATAKTMDGRLVAPIHFDSISDAKDFIEKNSDIQGFEIHGMDDFVFQFISDKYPHDIDYDIDLIRVFNFDIETKFENGFPEPSLANQEITAITIHDSFTKKYWVFTTVDSYKTHMNDINYVPCRTEDDLLTKFLFFWSNNQPDIITGWNITSFDVPYIINRLKRLYNDDKFKQLSPFGIVKAKTFRGKWGRDIESYDIAGINNLDCIDLYRKYVLTKRETYKLAYIGKVEKLGVEKIDYSEEGNLEDLRINNPQKYIEYNIRDVELVNKILDKHDFLGIVYFAAYKTKVPYKTVMGPVATWDAYIYNYFKTIGIVPPPRKERRGVDTKFEGAVVKEPYPGKYRWMVSLDATALYPSVTMQWNIGPDTLVVDVPDNIKSVSIDNLVNGTADLSFAKDNNLTIAANKTCYRKHKRSVLATLFKELQDERTAAKKEMLALKQEVVNEEASGKKDDPQTKAKAKKVAQLRTKEQALKIALSNSGYGACGNSAFRYYDVKIAEAITISGQWAIRWAEKRINQYLKEIIGIDQDYVVMIDTDALYLNLEPLIAKLKIEPKGTEFVVNFIDKLCKDKIQPFLDGIYTELFDYSNSYEKHIWLKRENIADNNFVVAKKRYAMNVWDSEGVRYEKAEVKVTGFEAVRSSTPEWCRDNIKKAIEIILNKNEEDLHKYIEEVRKSFYKVDLLEVAFPRTVNGLETYEDAKLVYKKGTPIAVKGALVYNSLLKTNGLLNKYRKIEEGDSIKFFHLQEPNPFNVNVIAFPDILPDEFDIKKYLDYTIQFEKTFLEPIENITEAIGWKIKPDRTEGLF